MGLRCLVLGVAMAAAGGTASAQDVGLGRTEYLSSCSQCHGLEGAGDGIIAQYLTVAPPDLRTLQRRNGGVFPFQSVFETIEGGRVSDVHGSREMPAWGNRYAAEAPWELGFQHSAAERDNFIRTRILALVSYLATVQAE